MIEKTRRGPHQYQAFKQLRSGNGRQQADAAADRMTHEGDAAAQVKRITHLQNILRITRQAGVAFGVKRGQVGFSGANIIKQHLSVCALEGRRHAVPHGLVASKTMPIQENRTGVAQNVDVIATNDVQRVLVN